MLSPANILLYDYNDYKQTTTTPILFYWHPSPNPNEPCLYINKLNTMKVANKAGQSVKIFFLIFWMEMVHKRYISLKPMDQNFIMQVQKFSVVMSLIFDKKSKIFTQAIVQNNILRPYRLLDSRIWTFIDIKITRATTNPNLQHKYITLLSYTNTK